MLEYLPILISFVTGYILCYHSMHSANSVTKQALDSLLVAFNARFGVRATVTTPVKEKVATEPVSSIITDEKDIPVKTQFDLKPPDLKMLRQQAITKKDTEARELQRELGLIKDHL